MQCDAQPARSVRGIEVRPAGFRRPVYCLLGIPIDALTQSEAVQRIRTAVASHLPCRFVTPNVHFMITAHAEPAFRDSIIAGDLAVADGMPLIWIARLLGVPLKERVAGADLFEALLRGEGGNLKVYFFGAPDGVAEKASQRLNALAGPVQCVGFASPGFGSVEALSAPETIGRINASGADFVVVALGAKKGQAWIERNRRDLIAPVVSHLGAVVNFVAGTLVRAPRWMQSSGLEWLWRIQEEPQLWRRYWQDARVLFPMLLTHVLPTMMDRTLATLSQLNKPVQLVIEPVADDSRPTRVALSGSWRASDAPLLCAILEELVREPKDIEVNLSGLERVDGAFIALMMLLRGHQCEIGRGLSIPTPPPRLQRIFRHHCAEFLLRPQ
jgi:N-acetylglucosaminyldiphosphoundecaprenol N-acetyl-beta-D-mannosaminyltransferase